CLFPLTQTLEHYTLSLHDALPISPPTVLPKVEVKKPRITVLDHELAEEEKQIAREKKNAKPTELDKALNDSKVSKTLSIFGGNSDRKSTRLNSSHRTTSYAVFCLK